MSSAAGQLPWVDFGGGVELRLVRVDLAAGSWGAQSRLAPGAVLPEHTHVGPARTLTLRGAWGYTGRPEQHTAGSYVVEPAGATHTQVVPAGNDGPTVLWSVFAGEQLVAEPGGQVAVVNAGSVLAAYVRGAITAGFGIPPVPGAT